MNTDLCPECQAALQLMHTLRKELVLVGYCLNHKKEYYQLPDGKWVDRKAWIEFKKEFN